MCRCTDISMKLLTNGKFVLLVGCILVKLYEQSLHTYTNLESTSDSLWVYSETIFVNQLSA